MGHGLGVWARPGHLPSRLFFPLGWASTLGATPEPQFPDCASGPTCSPSLSAEETHLWFEDSWHHPGLPKYRHGCGPESHGAQSAVSPVVQGLSIQTSLAVCLCPSSV